MNIKRPISTFLSFFFILSGFQLGCAHASSRLIRGTGEPLAPELALSAISAGDILVLGEIHGCQDCRDFQLEVLQKLRQKGLKVAVGMEFLEYPQQQATDRYRAGELSEADFLKAVQWGGYPFALYRDQIRFPSLLEGARTRALNAPRALTRKISQYGLSSLTESEREQLPPGLTRGNDRYFERFRAQMGNHVPDPAKLENYFWAQSVWDETMAWQSLSETSAHPEQVFVIVVGEFHVRYGGGLPDRLKARGAQKVWTLSQFDESDLTSEEVQEELGPHPIDGPRADFIWIFKK